MIININLAFDENMNEIKNTVQIVQIIVLTPKSGICLIPKRGGYVHEYIDQPISEAAKLIAEVADLLVSELPSYITLDAIKVNEDLSTNNKIALNISVFNEKLNQFVVALI